MRNTHALPIHFKRHAALMLLPRFELNLDAKIRFVFIIRKKALWIITVEEYK